MFEIIVIILLGFLLIISIPTALSFLIIKVIKKFSLNKRLRLLALLPFLVLGYLIYSAIYPGDYFYELEFKEVTGIELPKNAEIQYKTATYPDLFGDYTSISIIKVSEEFYNNLPKKLLAKGLGEDPGKIRSITSEEVLKQIENRNIVQEFSYKENGGVYYYVGFLSDQKSIIVKRLSW